MDLSKTAKLISELRKEKGVTQREIAEKLGVSPKTISKWETGHGFPDISIVSELSKVFEVDISKLIEGEMPQIKPEVGKEHYISFFSYVRFDRVMTIKLYPEQDGELIFPQMRGGKMYYYCNTHGLFELKIQ